jgi:thiamine-monophosphate kinase
VAPPAYAGSFDLPTRQSGALLPSEHRVIGTSDHRTTGHRVIGSLHLTVSSLGESALIERIRRRASVSRDWVAIGIGDDAAVLEPPRGALDILTTDCLIEGVHFRRDWTPPDAIGHKALAVNLSDLAAMGADPRAILLSLAFAPEFPLADFDRLVDGFVTLAQHVNAPIVGGNLSRSPGPLIVDVTVLGTARRRRVLTRAGGRPGDGLFLTGPIGGAATGLAILEAGVASDSLSPAERACVARYERPEARLTCGVQVGRNRAASACVDLSDGLADAARQISAASRTGVVIEADGLPVHAGALEWAGRQGRDPLPLALSGGEDYELLFAVRRRQRGAFLAATTRCRGTNITRVGRLTVEPGAWLERAGHLTPLVPGFAHF